MNDFQKMIKEICDKRNISVELLSKEWILKLTKGEKVKYILGCRFPFNNQNTMMCCNDKYATYEIMKNAGIPIIEHKLMYDKRKVTEYESDFSSDKEIKEYLKLNKKLVVKDTLGSGGRDVYLAKNILQVKSALKKVFNLNYTAVISPFIDIDSEYRVICLDGNVEVIFEKVRTTSSWKHNLSQGAEARLVEDEKIKQIISKMALKAMDVIDARFASVDIVRRNDEYMIIEINSGVYMNKFMEQVPNGREIGRRVYEKAIDKIFE